MIRKLLSNRALFAVGVGLVAYPMILDGNRLNEAGRQFQSISFTAGAVLIAFALWGLIAGLATGLRLRQARPDVEDSEDQTERRTAA